MNTCEKVRTVINLPVRHFALPTVIQRTCVFRKIVDLFRVGGVAFFPHIIRACAIPLCFEQRSRLT